MERRRVLKRALISFAVLAAGLGALGLYVDRALSAPDLKPRLEKATSEYLGRPVTIDSLELWRRRGLLLAKGFKVYEDPARTRLLVDSPAVEAHIALLSLFKLAAGVTELRFISPRVFLRRDADGEWNAAKVVSEIAARPSEGGRSWGTLAFNWFTVAGGTVTVEDSAGDLGLLPPVGVEASGKLRLGRHHAHFPFTLDGKFLKSPATLALTGDLGGRSRLHAELRHGDPALARPLWPPAADWRQAKWRATLDYDARDSKAWRLAARAGPILISTAVPAIDAVDARATFLPPSTTFFGVARSSGTEIRVRGASSGTGIDLDVTSRETDVAALLRIVRGESALAAKSRRRATARPGKPSRITATVAVDRLDWGPTSFDAVRAVVSHSTGPWALEHLSMRGLGGAIAGSGRYDPSASGAITLDWTTSGVSLQQLFRIAGSSREASGTLDSAGRIETRLGDAFLPAMNGKVSLDLKDGWLGGMPGLLKVMTKLNLATLFSKMGKHHQARVPFDEAHGSLTIANGKATTDHPLILKNKTLLIGYLGSVDLPAQTLDGRVVVQVLTVTDELVKLIPGLRDILLGKAKSMTPVWVGVKGKASDPQVDVLEGKTVTAPFWRAIKRVMKLPEKLGKKLGL